MATTHTYNTSLEIYLGGGDLREVNVAVRFTYSSAKPDYFDKGMGCHYPGDPEEIEVLSVNLSLPINKSESVNLDCHEWLSDMIIEKIDHGNLREVAAEDHAAAMDARAEARASA
jgi:hypothetical protein